MPTTTVEQRMSWRAIAQVSLLNMAVALMVLPLESTLNRIMIVELQISATLVALLIALRFITSPLRIWFGRVSDVYPIAGRRRTWYIAAGMLLMAISMLLIPHAAFAIPTLGPVGVVLAFLAFGLLGFGVNLTTPLYFAIVSDQSSEQQHSRIVAVMFIALGISVIAGSAITSVYLRDYSDAKLFNVFYITSGLVVLMTILGLVGLERRVDTGFTPARQESVSFDAIRRLLGANTEVLRFFVFLVLTFIAVEAQEVILEPYGAQVFGMLPDETTRLTAVFRSGFLIMLAVGALLVNRLGYRAMASIGIGVAVFSLGIIMAAGQLVMMGLFIGGVFGFGLGVGVITITNLTLMMNMTDPRSAGTFLGTWGFAQAVGVASGTLLGGILRDLGLELFGAPIRANFVVFSFQILLLVVALPFIWRLSVTRFRESCERITTTQILVRASD